MQRKLATSPDTDTVVEAQVIDEKPPQKRREFLVAHPPGEPEGFIDTDEVCKRLQVSRGTIAAWRKHGLPHVITPGARSVRFFWPSVRDYLLRQQRNAA
jgi:predicted DNA-binding transcriptional regulator AlpA